jgi:hypothetical protein
MPQRETQTKLATQPVILAQESDGVEGLLTQGQQIPSRSVLTYKPHVCILKRAGPAQRIIGGDLASRRSEEEFAYSRVLEASAGGFAQTNWVF